MSGQANLQGPPKGKEMYEAFVLQCRKVYKEDKVQSGIFGSTCEIALINDVSCFASRRGLGNDPLGTLRGRRLKMHCCNAP